MYFQASDLLAEKRGNFVVVGCVEGSKVVSWSLNVRTLVLLFVPVYLLTRHHRLYLSPLTRRSIMPRLFAS